jgi:hypothetical protein
MRAKTHVCLFRESLPVFTVFALILTCKYVCSIQDCACSAVHHELILRISLFTLLSAALSPLTIC